MIVALLAATMLLADTAPAAAPTTPAAKTDDAAKSKVATNKDGLVCRNEAIIGTRFPKKICYRPEELAARTQDDRANLEHAQRLTDPGH